jgi:hypothetical protein
VIAAGVVLAALVAVSFFFFRRLAGRSTHPQRRGSETQRVVLLHRSLEEAEARCRQVLGDVATLREPPQDDAPHVLEAVSSFSGRSVGSVLRLEFRTANDGTSVLIKGWPGAALYDWGASKRLVLAIADALVEPPDAGPVPPA